MLPAVIKLPGLALVWSAAVVTLAPCASTPPTPEPTTPEPVAHEHRATPMEAATVATPEPEPEPEPPPPPDPVLADHGSTIHSPITPAIAARLREVASGAEWRQPNVFAKMGGSSIESHAYLHCFASDRYTDIGEYAHLEETLAFFRSGNAQGRSPFRRESLSAEVGWSLRQGLTGRPPRYLQETQEIGARFALMFFGGNDVQGRNSRTFGNRLQEVIEELLRRNVIPIIGATSPRGDEEEMDVWARRYNRVSRGIAQAWQVPYLDFYLAQQPLPRRGLAGDGVHSNVHREDRRGRPCSLTDEGLEHGMNVRNLITLELLDRMRRHVIEDEPAPDPAPQPLHGEGTAAMPLRLARVPYGDRVSITELGATLSGYTCPPERGDEEPIAFDGTGGERVYRVRVEEPTSVVGSAYGRGRVEATVLVLGEDLDPAGCRAIGEDLKLELEPGVHHFVVETSQRERPGEPRDEPAMTFVLDTDPD